MPAGAASVETKAQTKKDLNLIRLLPARPGREKTGYGGIVAAGIRGRFRAPCVSGVSYNNPGDGRNSKRKTPR